MDGVGPSKLQLNLLDFQILPSAAGPGDTWLGDFLRLGTEGGGEAGRGQLDGLFGGRIVRQALDDLGQTKFACAGA